MKNNILRFFDDGNNWDLNKIRSGSYPEPLQSHLFKMLSNAESEKLPFIVPRLDENKQLWFYVVSDNLLQLNEIISMVKAYLGNSYIYLDPVEYKSSSDAIEKVLLEKLEHGFCRLAIPIAINVDKSSVYWVFDSLNKLIQQYHERPNLLRTIKRPVGTILRSFFTACKHRRGESAYDCYLELKVQQSLSNRNILSIEFQALYAASKWNDILFHPKVSDLLSGRVPRKLQAIFLRTIKEKIFNTFNIENSDLDLVKQSLLPYQTLFFSPPDIPKSEEYIHEWQSWVIGACAYSNAKVNQFAPDIIDTNWVKSVAVWAGLTQPHIQIQSEISKVSHLDTLLCEEPCTQAAQSLLQESLFADYAIAKRIYLRLSNYPSSIISGLLEKVAINNIWQNLDKEYGEQTEIIGWNSVFNYLSQDNPANEIKNIIQVVAQQFEYWKKSDVDIDELNVGIQSLSNSAASLILRDLLPLFIEWVEKTETKLSPDSIEHLMLTLVIDENNSIEDLLLCNDLIDQLLLQPHSKTQYVAMVDAIAECWSNVESINALEHCLEVFENLYDSPCACKNTRLTLWNSIQSFVIQNWVRLTPIQKFVIRDTCKALIGTVDHLPSELEEKVEQKIKIDLSGKKLAIYSLTETALKRSSTALKLMYPELDIATNHDKSATEALKHLVNSADYFVFAAKSAAHQAFYAITDKRKDLIYPLGKGSSSIIRCFNQFLEIQHK
ncbi:protein DpdD [Thalassotalea crassostreae]|uniref:protein DpdD n=1 Tax=Thalassotalea crassostreae TaxID=1763536 RepID=UPI000837DE72|nr:protein DpdD [Thalassotalea crassostreae]